jgi:Flp pilus assembly protein TadB
MAACLLAGQPVTAATQASATAIGGPLGDRLSWVSAQLRLGADPEPTWAFLAREPAMAQLSRAMGRAAQSGAPVADVLNRLADDARDATRAASVAAARGRQGGGSPGPLLPPGLRPARHHPRGRRPGIRHRPPMSNRPAL